MGVGIDKLCLDYVKLMGYGYVDENNETQVTNGLLEGMNNPPCPLSPAGY